MYAVPAGMTLKDALYGLFRHYVSKPVSSATSNIDAPSLDALAFSKFCKDAPHLDSLNRGDLDLVFNKSKKIGGRKLYFGNFLDALGGLACMLYHKENPIDALVKLLAYQILGLFDQEPVPDSLETFMKIKEELMWSKRQN